MASGVTPFESVGVDTVVPLHFFWQGVDLVSPCVLPVLLCCDISYDHSWHLGISVLVVWGYRRAVY